MYVSFVYIAHKCLPCPQPAGRVIALLTAAVAYLKGARERNSMAIVENETFFRRRIVVVSPVDTPRDNAIPTAMISITDRKVSPNRRISVCGQQHRTGMSIFTNECFLPFVYRGHVSPPPARFQQSTERSPTLREMLEWWLYVSELSFLLLDVSWCYMYVRYKRGSDALPDVFILKYVSIIQDNIWLDCLVLEKR